MKTWIKTTAPCLALLLGAAALPADTLTVEGDLNVEGNVGIGTETPSAKLEVVGDVKITGGTLTAPSVTLPDGTLTTARSTTLYNAAGEPVATVGPDGKVNFTNGVSFGSDPSATITNNSAAYLNQTLANLGFRENPVTPTHVRQIELTGNVNVRFMTAEGGFTYVIGAASGDCTVGGLQLSIPAPSVTGFIAKIPNAEGGQGGWIKSITSSLRHLAIDSDGNAFACGAFSGTIDRGDGVSITSAGSNDGVILKLNEAGVIQWAKVIGGANSDNVSSIALDGSGSVFLVGSFSGSIVNVGGTSGVTVNSAGGKDGMLLKLNNDGVVQWVKAIGGSADDELSAVSVDNMGSVFIGGSFGQTIGNVAGASGVSVVSAGALDGLLVKMDNEGGVQWTKSIGGTGSESVFSLCVDSLGDAIIGLHFSGTITNLGGESGVNVSAAGSRDGLVVKVDASGVVKWARSVGTPGYDTMRSLVVDSLNNVAVVGDFSGGLFPGGGVTLNLNSRIIVTYDSTGTFSRMLQVKGNFPSLNIADGKSIMWGSGLDTAWRIGDAVIISAEAQGGYAIQTNTLDIVTPTPTHSALSWGSGYATNQGVALGSESYASGEGSIAVGSGYAIAAQSFSAGDGHASGEGSTAMGYSTASGEFSTAWGWAHATGRGATAVGDGATASGHGATAIGFDSYADGFASIAVGLISHATGYTSVAMGNGVIASGDSSVALGFNTHAQSLATTTVGSLNIAQGDAATWVPTDDLFVVGNGSPSTWDRSNAFVVHKNGNVRAAGNLDVRGTIRVAPSGDLSMGTFVSGANPADEENGLNAGLRYPGE